MSLSTIFFDLDATLYDPRTGLWDAIRLKITEYLREVMQFSAEEAERVRNDYYTNYGTSLRGLMANYQVDPVPYLEYVHNVPTAEYLSPDPALRELILSLPQKKWIFTNSDEAHTLRVLDSLGLLGCFDGMVTVETMGYDCKPNAEVYHLALTCAGETDFSRTAFIEDSTRNLKTARALGMRTILVGSENPAAAADFTMPDIHHLREVVPQLWQNNSRGNHVL